MRIVALGASNLTRGLHPLVCAARASWGPEVEVICALGHGRSYGASSRFLVRTLPGILQCGLWRELESGPRLPTRALVTDVGNDILYGFSATATLAWVEQCVLRLRAQTDDVTLTDLPLAGIRALSKAKFLLFRSLFVPSCRLSLGQVAATAERVTDGLVDLARRHSLRLVRLRPEWYGFDPIHIRPARWRAAWQEILCGGELASGASGSRLEGLRLYLMRPERERLFGLRRERPQAGTPLPGGGRLKLY